MFNSEETTILKVSLAVPNNISPVNKFTPLKDPQSIPLESAKLIEIEEPTPKKQSQTNCTLIGGSALP